MPTWIKSKQNEWIQSLRLLQLKKGPFYPAYFLVEGEHLVEAALKAKAVETLVVVENLKTRYPEADVFINESIADALSQHKSVSGVFALCKKPHVTTLPLRGTKFVYLDGLQDPGNVGTILRTALAFGFDGVLYHETTADPYGFKSIQSSQGAIFSLPLQKITRDQLIAYQNQGYTLCGATLDAHATPLDQWVSPSHVIVLLGHEGQGLHPQSQALLDQNIRIPMGKIDSLNVAIAFGIFAYTLRE